LILSVLLASQLELNLNLDLATLQALSGRGGTSGIGIHGFFSGGFVVDAGHPQSEIITLAPSSQFRPRNPPMLMLQLPTPSRWRFHLIVPRGTIREGGSEVDFFACNTPVLREHVHEAISTTYHGLVAAVRDSDLEQLGAALRRLHQIAFKDRELRGQGTHVRDVYHRLLATCSAPVGMSSMGPLLYVVLDAQDERGVSAIRQISEDTESEYLGSFASTSAGPTILR
jgi:beta-ribofuranosylaminobenzene 5'-phosphate synthase